MIEWILSFVPWWAWGLVGLTAAGAAWTYLGARAGLGVLVGMALWAAYLGGVASERERGEAAGLKAELAIARDDIAKAKRAETDAAGRVARLDATTRSNQDIINELSARLDAQEAEKPLLEPVPPPQTSGVPAITARTAPARSCRCGLTQSGDSFLRSIQ